VPRPPSPHPRRARRAARAARDFKRADAIREELSAMGVVIEDGAQGTRWSVAKG